MPAPLTVAVASCSLSSTSRSHNLALAAAAAVRSAGAEPLFVDLREWELPICDGSGSFDHSSVEPLSEAIGRASAILISAPVYNYDLNAAAKNLVEMTGKSWMEKPVGFLCSAGGERSYMSPIGLANSLMLDFRCLIIPRFVYCTEADFDDEGALGASLRERVETLTRTAIDLASALAWVEQQRRSG